MTIIIAVTSATAERSFSCLKRIKNYLRSTMSQERLNNLTLLHIERDLSPFPSQPHKSFIFPQSTSLKQSCSEQGTQAPPSSSSSISGSSQCSAAALNPPTDEQLGKFWGTCSLPVPISIGRGGVASHMNSHLMGRGASHAHFRPTLPPRKLGEN